MDKKNEESTCDIMGVHAQEKKPADSEIDPVIEKHPPNEILLVCVDAVLINRCLVIIVQNFFLKKTRFNVNLSKNWRGSGPCIFAIGKPRYLFRAPMNAPSQVSPVGNNRREHRDGSGRMTQDLLTT